MPPALIFDKTLTPTEAADVLHDLARRIAGQKAAPLRVRIRETRSLVQLTVGDPEEDSPVFRKREVWRVIKQKMDRHFHRMLEDVNENRKPLSSDITAFLDLSRTMLESRDPDHGAAFFLEYRVVCERLERAMKEGESAAIAKSIQELETIRLRCHHRYWS